MTTNGTIKKAANSVHEYLYSHVKLSDTEKTTLVAGIFIALDNAKFRKGYEDIETADELKQDFINAISNAIDNCEGLKTGKKEIKATFLSLQDNKVLFSFNKEEKAPLVQLLNIINKYVYELAIEEDHDIIHHFYNEFTRRSGADQQTLGIVLTPEHIASFMADLLDIQEDDIILDTCFGTGSLVMQADRKNNVQNKSIGVELNARMLAFGVANMILRGGDFALYHGSAWDEEIIEELKKHKPTKMILNPPYAQKGFEELGFVEKGLDSLIVGGLGVAIMPMSCGMKMDLKSKAYRKSIMSKHTLLASFTMPSDLFTPVAVHTMVMLFKAHTKHNTKTYFGDLTVDGFYGIPQHGRGDWDNRWESIRSNLFNSYITSENIPGIGQMAKCSAKEEWVTEAFMITKYQGIVNEALFSSTFVSYIKEDIKKITQLDKLSDLLKTIDKSVGEKVELPDISTWVEYTYDSIFDMKRGQGPSATAAKKVEGDTKYVGASEFNNGVTCLTGLPTTHYGNNITIANNGSIGATFYQETAFTASSDVTVLNPKFGMNKYIALFLKTLILLEKPKYSYGRKWGITRMKKSTIKLPSIKVDGINVPDLRLMDSYIKGLKGSVYL